MQVPSMESNESFVKTQKAKRHFYQIGSLIGLVVILVGIGRVLGVLSTPMGIVFWAIVFVFVLKSPVAFFQRHGIPRPLGAAISYLLMFAVLFALGAIMFSPTKGLSDQLANLVESVPVYVDSVMAFGSGIYAQYSDILNNTAVNDWFNTASASITEWANKIAASSASGIVDFGTGLANSLMIIGFALVVAFWLLMELPAIGREVKRLIPESRKEESEVLSETVNRVVSGWLRATLVVCALVGVLCAVAYGIAGVPNAAALGLIAGLLNVIPVVGHWIGLVLVAGIALFTSPIAGLIVAIVTFVIQEVIYTFVQPKLMGDSVDVHPVLVIIAMFIGSAAGGYLSGLFGSIMGMLISIPVAAIAKSLFVYYYEKHTGLQVVAEDGVFFKGTPSQVDEELHRPDYTADALAPSPTSKNKPSPWLTGTFSTSSITRGRRGGHASDGGAAGERGERGARNPRESAGKHGRREVYFPRVDEEADTLAALDSLDERPGARKD